MDGESKTSEIQSALLENLQEFTAFARKRVADPDLAADVIQDSLLKALKSEKQPTRKEDAVTWFYRILRNAIIDIYRKQDVQRRGLESLQQNDLPTTADKREICRCLNRIVPTLKSDYAELIREIDLNDTPIEAMAKKLKVTPNNLNVRLFRARKQLQKRLVETCQMCSTHGCLNCTCDSSD